MFPTVENFVFPNEMHHLAWTVMIVLYPYITGLVAGAFVVAALYHVFGKEELKPVSRFALVASFCFCCFATTPLLLHLHQPQRAFNIMMTPNFNSAMSGFGFIYSFYLGLLTLEIFLIFRPQIIALAKKTPGVMGLVYKVMALGIVRESKESRHADHKLIQIFSVIGIPAACVLHGYVGFIFGAIKANPWWSSALMPIIFLVSAIVSGVSALIHLYLFYTWRRGGRVSNDCLRSMMKTLWLFLVVAFALEELDLLNKSYENNMPWTLLSQMVHHTLYISHTVLQGYVGSLVPLVLLPIGVWLVKSVKVRAVIGSVSALLVLVQVLAMRWNVVIGGQLFSKSYRGIRELHIDWTGKEGVLMAVIVFCLPFVLLAVLVRILPVWETDDPPLAETPAE